MQRLKGIIILIGTLFFYNLAFTNIIVVSNTLDSGIGSLRNAVSIASTTANDTILINVKGSIALSSTINLEDFDALTIIGAFPKHTTITSAGTWTGSFFNLNSCEDIVIRGIGFAGGTGTSRHFTINGSPEEILFERCLFEGNTTTQDGGVGEITNSEVKFSKCSFINNVAANGGALLIKSNSTCIIENCTFSNNSATGNSGAINIESSSEVDLLFNTIVNNSAGAAPQAINSGSGTTVTLENNAIGFNGVGIQLNFGGTRTSYGGNRVRLNTLGEILSFITIGSDLIGVGLDFGLRTTILTDGFGLKYWPIVSASSVLINPKATSASAPAYDCRNAPRSLKGNGSLAYADAGACEYTHLRVTNSSGSSADPNSLLWAMQPAQRKEELHFIEFDIPIVGSITINSLSSGAMSTKGYIIDGFSQQGTAIPGPALWGGSGLTPAVINIALVKNLAVENGIQFALGTNNSIVQGLSIQGFDNSGISISAQNIAVYGCEIGVNQSGVANGNAGAGISVTDNNNKIGGWEHWMRNVVSGNGSSTDVNQPNIYLQSNNNLIQGNIIGGGSDGISFISGPFLTKVGIFGGEFTTNFNLIGGSQINSGNVIIGNQNGIYFSKIADYNNIEGNHIGIGWDELTPLGNSTAGISLNGADANTIGGLSLKQGNIIAYNGKGISLQNETTTCDNILIIGNSIYQNTGQGIDFEDDGLVEPNDGALDASKQNQSLDYPELILSENCDGVNTKTSYRIRVPTGVTYRVEFFTNTIPDGTNGEGEQFIGSHIVTPITNPQVFTYTYPGLLSPGTNISATISSENITSEFGTNTTIIAERIAEISYLDTCFGNPINPVILGSSGGNFSFTDPIPEDGVLIDGTYGVITEGVEGASYEVVYAFTNGCANKDTVSASVIEVIEGFTFEDFCFGSESPAPITDGTPGLFLMIDLADGATIIPSSGIIVLPVEGVTYTVTHTVTNLGCSQSDTESVNVTNVDEYFEFEDLCFGEIGLPEAIATPGGIFSIVSPLDMATINSSTGEFSGGLGSETYTIRYIASVGECADTLELPVLIKDPNAHFLFPEFCPSSSSPEPTPEVPGGVFSFATSPLSGEIIIPETGVIVNPVEGTSYEISYEVLIDECVANDTVITSVMVVPQEFTASNFCWYSTSPAAIPDAPGGTFLFGFPLPIDGATINPVNGQISSANEGAIYEIVHSLTYDGCTQEDSMMVSAIGVNESFVFDDFCPHSDSPAPISVTSGGTYIFSEIVVDGATINPSSGVISNSVEGTSYLVTYTVSEGSCTENSEELVEVISIDESFTSNSFCAEFASEAPIPSVPGGTFSFEPFLADGATIDPTTGVITNALSDVTYGVKYVIGVCSESDTNLIYAKPSETASFSLENFCANLEIVPIIDGTSGGSFDFNPLPDDDAIIDLTTGLITNSFGGTYTIRYITPGSALTCQDSIEKIVTIYPIPLITSISSDLSIYCPYDEIGPILAIGDENSDLFYWHFEDLSNPILDSIAIYTPNELNIGNNLYLVQPKSEFGCFGDPQSLNLFLSDTAGMHAIQDFNVCLGSPAQLEAYNGTSYSWLTNIPLADYSDNNPIAFSLNPEIYIVTIKNNEGCEVTDSVKIDFLSVDQCEIVVYNAFSPNEDGKNDFWYIEHLINFMPNTVYLYTRWGDELVAIENYDNINNYWKGQDKHGNDLPPGTYFYVVITENDELNQAGWIQLVR